MAEMMDSSGSPLKIPLPISFIFENGRFYFRSEPMSEIRQDSIVLLALLLGVDSGVILV